MVSNIVKGPHPFSTAYCVGMVVALVVNRHAFRGAADPPSLFRLIRLAPLYVGSVLLVGYASLLVERSNLDAPLTLWGGLQTIVEGLVGIHGPYTYERPFFDAAFPKALLLLGIFGALGAAIPALSSAAGSCPAHRARLGPGPRPRARVRVGHAGVFRPA